MKKQWLILPIIALLILSTEQDQSVEYLLLKSGCNACHDLAENGIGPSYKGISERYKEEEASRKTLFDSVKNGSKGKWPEIAKGSPMAGYEILLSNKEIERMVNWVLKQ